MIHCATNSSASVLLVCFAITACKHNTVILAQIKVQGSHACCRPSPAGQLQCNASSLQEPDGVALLVAASCGKFLYICLQAFLILFDSGMR